MYTVIVASKHDIHPIYNNLNGKLCNDQPQNSGPMYRSAIYCEDETELELAKKSAEKYQQNLNDRGIRGILAMIANYTAI